jgi:hypothetical protein
MKTIEEFAPFGLEYLPILPVPNILFLRKKTYPMGYGIIHFLYMKS